MSRCSAIAGILSAVAAASCDSIVEPPRHPCDAVETEVDIAPPRALFDDFGDGSELWGGTPPQGGAPYTPIRARVRGPMVLLDGMDMVVTVTDSSSAELLSHTELQTRMTCANVGESAGFWVGSEIHVRYPGWSTEQLTDREALMSVRVSSLDGSVVVQDDWLVWLVLE